MPDVWYNIFTQVKQFEKDNTMRKKRPIVVRCDYCNKVFTLEQHDLVEREFVLKGEPIIFHGFRCRNCGHLYKVIIRSPKSNSISNEIARLRQLLDTEINLRKALGQNVFSDLPISRLRNKIKYEISLLNAELKRLKEKYTGTFTINESKDKSMDIYIDYRESTEEEENGKS